jgi:hypothetical protein
MSVRAPGVRSWLAAGVALTAILWLGDMAAGIGTGDEAWWLQIAGRLEDGDAPYEDFFLGVLPLPLYVTSAATSVLGLELWVAKLLIDVSIAATALLAARTALAAGVPLVGATFVGAASLAFVVLPTVTLYSPLSYFFLLACLALVLAWHRAALDGAGARRTDLLLLSAGALAGASLAGKQTVGAGALVALLASVLIYSHRPVGLALRFRDAGVALAGAAIVVAAALAPVALAGDLDAFREQALDKGEYASSGAITYWEGLGDLFSAADFDGWLLRFVPVYLAPVAAIALLVAAVVRRPRAELVPVGLFAVAAIAAALPRASYLQMSDAMPLCALAIGVSIEALRSREAPASSRSLKRPAAVALAAVLVVAGGAGVLRTPLQQFSDGASRSTLPHLSGVVLTDLRAAGVREQAEAIREADAGEDRTMLLLPNASLLYLTSGIQNPTRHDYPLLTAIRRDGQLEAIQQIRSGALRRVCLGSFDGDPSMRPTELVDFVSSELRPLLTQAPSNVAPTGGPDSCVLLAPRVRPPTRPGPGARDAG